jgi:DNA modification methylase
LPEYLVKDYKEAYKPVMQFNKNKAAFIHQWYPFVEGYSKDFINSIIDELDYTPQAALDPFAGSGTTPVELQDLDISCNSFEVSPFMHLLATVKLENGYTLEGFNDSLITVGKFLERKPQDIRSKILPPLAQTFQSNGKLKKWVFNTSVMDGILDIKYAISLVHDEKYRDLFKIALASILLEVSNVYRNGKCLSYKEGWINKRMRRATVHKKFLSKLVNTIQPDIIKIEGNEYEVSNKRLCRHGDVRKKIDELADHSIDLVITSPPYLNSRDYTDIYMVELWILDLVKDYESIRTLRKSTVRSHVQVKYGELALLEIPELKKCISKLEKKGDLWNDELPEMIKGYFLDMDTLFAKLKRKMQPGKKIFFNVANSAYYGVEIKVDEIVCAIAEQRGFVVEEIREARRLKPSSQQKEQIESLRESVIVITS